MEKPTLETRLWNNENEYRAQLITILLPKGLRNISVNCLLNGTNSESDDPSVAATCLRIVRIWSNCKSTSCHLPASPIALIAALLPSLMQKSIRTIFRHSFCFFQVILRSALYVFILGWLQTVFASMLLTAISCQSKIANCHLLASWNALMAWVDCRIATRFLLFTPCVTFGIVLLSLMRYASHIVIAHD